MEVSDPSGAGDVVSTRGGCVISGLQSIPYQLWIDERNMRSPAAQEVKKLQSIAQSSCLLSEEGLIRYPVCSAL